MDTGSTPVISTKSVSVELFFFRNESALVYKFEDGQILTVLVLFSGFFRGALLRDETSSQFDEFPV